MARIIHLTVALAKREFIFGSLFGIGLTIASIAGLFQFGAFPKESEGLILSADYRLSRTETRLREEIRYLEQELAISRGARSSSASYASDTRS